MNKLAFLFITCISATSCVNFDRASNTTNYYEYNMTFEQACIFKKLLPRAKQRYTIICSSCDS